MSLATDRRPQTFSEVYGQDKVVEILKKIAISKTLSVRALSLIGPPGTGKTSLMRLFAKALNCIEFQTGSKDLHVRDTCNSCLNCLHSTLYYEEDSATLSDPGRTTELLLKLHEHSTNLKQLVVFEEVQFAPEASINTLLRQVEEGIPNTIIAFNSTKLLPPVLQSRCTTLKLNSITTEMLMWRLEEEAKRLHLSLHPYWLTLLASLAQGQLRQALNLLEQFSLGGKEAVRTPYFKVLEFITNKAKSLPNTDTIRELMTYNGDEVLNAFKIMIVNSYRKAGDLETALYTTGLVEKLYNFTYLPQNVQAVMSKEGLETFLHRLSNLP